jgi:hypothetical protein
MSSTNPTMHRDGTITYWSVYQQSWCYRVEADMVPDHELAAMSDRDRSRALRHIERNR